MYIHMYIYIYIHIYIYIYIIHTCIQETYMIINTCLTKKKTHKMT